MNRIRGLVLVVGASFVLAALVTTVFVKVADDLAAGVGVQSGDLTTFGIAGLGATAVLGISGRALWRERQSIGWRLYGALVVIVVIVGVGVGLAFGTRISREHVAYVREVAVQTCAEFVVVHPAQASDCVPRAIACRAEVHAAPPVVERGLRASDAPGVSAEPTDPEERAIWACLER